LVLERLEDRRLLDGNLLFNFPGMDVTAGGVPPEPDIAVGPQFVVETTRNAISIYSRTTGQSVNVNVPEFNNQPNPLSTDNFYSQGSNPLPRLANSSTGVDTMVSYDELAGRFIVASTEATDTSGVTDDPSNTFIGHSYIDFAVSDTSDPRDGFSEKQRIEVTEYGSAGRVIFADYPKMGWNADACVVVLNMSPHDTAGDVSSDVHIQSVSIDKSSVLGKGLSQPTYYTRDFLPGSPHPYVVPATMHGSSPGDPMWFGENGTGNEIEVGHFKPLTADPNSLITETRVPVDPYTEPPNNVLQPGGHKITTGAIDWGVYNAEWRDNRLVVSQEVGLSTDSDAHVRWYEVSTANNAPSLTQEGTLSAGTGISTFYPTIAIAHNGDIGLNYMEAGSSVYLSDYVTGHKPGDPMNAMETPILLHGSTTDYFDTVKGVANDVSTVGHYTGISADPITNGFWAANEYASSDSTVAKTGANWATWIGNFGLEPVEVNVDGGGQTGASFTLEVPILAPDLLDVRVNKLNVLSVPRAAILGVYVQGSSGDDHLSVNNSALSVYFDGAGGKNSLQGPGADNTWKIHSTDRGSVGNLNFSNVGSLIGGNGNDTFAFDIGAGLSGTIDGGGGSNTVTFAGNDFDTWVLTGPSAGVVAGSNNFAFTAIQSLVGGTAFDTFVVAANEQFAGTIDGGGGADELLYEGTGGETVNLQTGTASRIGGFKHITAVIGTGTGNTLIGADGKHTWNLTGTDSGYIDGTFMFTSFQNLTGGSGDDSFTFQAPGHVTGTIDGGAGTNTLDYSENKGNAINVDLATNIISVSNPSGIAFADSFQNIDTFVGTSASSDTLSGPNHNTAWTLTAPNSGLVSYGQHSFHFYGIEILDGNWADDTFKFEPGGSLSGTISGNFGINTLDYSAYGSPVSVNLQKGTATATGGVGGIETVIGSGSGDTIVGANDTNDWYLTGSNSGNINGRFTFFGFANLIGGSTDDAFHFMPGGKVSGKLDGAGGMNSLDYLKNGGQPITVNLTTASATDTGGFVHIQRCSGSKASSTLVGPSAAGVTNTWRLTGSDAGNINGLYFFSDMSNLTGGRVANDFQFNLGSRVLGKIDGGAGISTLDYSLLYGNSSTWIDPLDGGANRRPPSFPPIQVNLQSLAATATGGISNVDAFVGSGSAITNTLVGPNLPAAWAITDDNTGTLQIKVGDVPSFRFTGVQNLIGGTKSDEFLFSNGKAVDGRIDGGGGGDWLDYSAYTTPVQVSLSKGQATGVSDGALGRVSNILNVRGGSGQNTLAGDAQNNILVGGVHNSALSGGAGRDLLIGGAGPTTTIAAGSGGAILIGGSTIYDNDNAALVAILAEWQRTDRTYRQRVGDLANGGGLNGTKVLAFGTTVHDDGSQGSLVGGTGMDWFLTNLASRVVGARTSEVISTAQVS
jgi:hypothetical protein